MDKMLNNPVVIATLVFAGAIFVALFAWLFRGKTAPGGKVRGLDKLIEQGRYREAATLAMQHDRLHDALDLWLRAQEPARAAAIALRVGNARLAGELFERAGDKDRAIRAYEQSGNVEKVAELKGSPAEPAKEVEEAPPTDPRERAKTVERSFREVLERGRDPASLAVAQDLARDAAEEYVALGMLEQAAEIYRDAELVDEAVHLYVNVLGRPGQAAPLVAGIGNHERAAELYELAGLKERAASTWSDVARGSPEPEAYLERVEGLSPVVAGRLLKDLTAARPASKATAALHYRYGALLEKLGEVAEALAVFKGLRDVVGQWRDLDERMTALRVQGRSPSGHPDSRGPPEEATAKATLGFGDGEREIDREEVAAIAREAAVAAVARSRRNSSIPPPMSPAEQEREAQRGAFPRPSRHPVLTVRVELPEVMVDRRGRTVALGLENAVVALDVLQDNAVNAARLGPSVTLLNKFIDGRPCDLGNIEVFFRLGMAHLATGDWDSAEKAFAAVEGASPGYRDAGKRVEEIARWRKAIGSKVSLAGGLLRGGGGDGERYKLQGELGRGGMAVVYRAKDTVLGRDVALKFLAEHLGGSPEMVELFQREARSVAQLNHPNVVSVYDVGSLEGRPFIAMEFVDGQTVDAMIEAAGKLPTVEALRIARQVLEALAYAHQKQIIHRDIKPSNMMRSSEGIVKIMDFGLAKSIAMGAKSSIVAGTPAYMPLEQVQGLEVDHRADLFAVGASLYEMLTGRLPFTNLDRSKAPPPVRSLFATIPEVVERTILTALENDPAKRFQSAVEFLVPIRRVLIAVEAAAGDAEQMVHEPEVMPRFESMRPPVTLEPARGVTTPVALQRTMAAGAPSVAPPAGGERETQPTPETLNREERLAAAEAAAAIDEPAASQDDGFLTFDAPVAPSVAPSSPVAPAVKPKATVAFGASIDPKAPPGTRSTRR